MTALAVLFVSVCFAIADCVLHRVDVPLSADPHKVSAVVDIFLHARKNKTKHCTSGASVFESHLCAISQAPLCLDGSQYAYGFRQGHGAGRRRWLIHLQVHLFKYMYADACMHLHMHAHTDVRTVLAQGFARAVDLYFMFICTYRTGWSVVCDRK